MMENLALCKGGRWYPILGIFLFALVSEFGLVPAADAAITKTGNVEPVGTWTSSTSAYVGKTGNGTLQVDGGSTILSDSAVIANSSGITRLGHHLRQRIGVDHRQKTLGRRRRRRNAEDSKPAEMSAIRLPISDRIPALPATSRSREPTRYGRIAMSFTWVTTGRERSILPQAGKSTASAVISA